MFYSVSIRRHRGIVLTADRHLTSEVNCLSLVEEFKNKLIGSLFIVEKFNKIQKTNITTLCLTLVRINLNKVKRFSFLILLNCIQ